MKLLHPEASRQIRETRTTILEHLRDEPDDLFALVMAEVLGEIDPDPSLAAARAHFRAIRGEDWRERARERGVDRMLFHLAHGMTEARIGRGVSPVLERYAIEISEARVAGVPAGFIDAACLPASLRNHARTTVTYWPSGHLRRVAINLDSMHNGELELTEMPGSGRFTLVTKRGEHGTMVQERYHDGVVDSTLNTPWHDGTEASEPMPWTKWVLASLDELAVLTQVKTRRGRRRRRAGRPTPA